MAWQNHLNRWANAGLLDAAAVERVREYEAGRRPSQRWLIWVALAFGAIALGAGILLFVSSQWDLLPLAGRLSLILALVAVFHVAGAALRERTPVAGMTLHALGTLALGAGISLTGVIYNMQEHWPASFLMWAAGAWLAYWLLRDWPQGLAAAVLTPLWLLSEWIFKVEHWGGTGWRAAPVFVLLLSMVYLTSGKLPLRYVGGLLLLPAGVMAALHPRQMPRGGIVTPSENWLWAAWILAFVLPLAVARVLRGRDLKWQGVATLWVAALAGLATAELQLLVYAWCALGAAGLVSWGIREASAERVNLGVAGFAITVITFFFAHISDKFGRSLSLIAFGILLLAGGWGLERVRRRALAQAGIGRES
jgi:uncharacterized membrane protein